MTGISGWTLVVEVPKEAVDIFDQAFSPIAVATSSFETSDQSIWRMEAFCVDRPDEMAVVGAVALAAEIAGIPEPTVHASALPDIDWVSENQKSFQPIIAGGFFVHPTHYDGEVPATATTLAIDAGPAFGTGSHGSTKGCLLALDWLSRRPPWVTSSTSGVGPAFSPSPWHAAGAERYWPPISIPTRSRRHEATPCSIMRLIWCDRSVAMALKAVRSNATALTA